MKYTDIKTFEDACKVLDIDPKTTLPTFPGENVQSTYSCMRAVLLAETIN